MVLVKVKTGHKLEGEGEFLGSDFQSNAYTFWRSEGKLDVPVELALQLELERPQRYEIFDREYAKYIFKIIGSELKEEKEVFVPEVKPETPSSKLEPSLTLAELKAMPTKDSINDWAAKRDYDVSGNWTRKKMETELARQIEKRTGNKLV